MSPSTHSSISSFRRGFSLVEFVVTIGIVVTITTIVLVSYQRFGNTTRVNSGAYNIALALRAAQTNSLAARELTPGSGIFDVSYGVHFDASTPTQYIYFNDADKDRRYDAGEAINVSSFTAGSITSLCATLTSNGTEKCAPTIQTLDIVFERPDPEAIISTDITLDVYSAAAIQLRAAQGYAERTIYVGPTGQISVLEPLGTSYSQSSYYGQSGYYTQSAYYNQGFYYVQSAYYAQGTYYTQSAYYNQSTYYNQSAYYAQSTYYAQSGYYGQGSYYGQSSYYSQTSYK